MRKSNPSTFQTRITTTVAMVTLGLMCSLNVAETKAQSTAKRSDGIQFAARVGEIRTQSINKPNRLTADELTSVEFANAEPKPIVSSRTATATAKLKIPSALKAVSTDASSGIPSSIPTKFFQKKPPASKAVGTSKILTTDKPTTEKITTKAGAKIVANSVEAFTSLPTENLNKKSTHRSVPSPNLLPPTVVVRPSVAHPNHLNKCVVEINEIRSTNDVSLKVAIPDSVTMIEVVPNRTSEAARNFRIQMEQGVKTKESPEVPSSRQAQLPPPAKQQHQAKNTNNPPVVPFETAARIAQRQRNGFARNPFFVEKVAQEKVSPKKVAAQSRPTNKADAPSDIPNEIEPDEATMLPLQPFPHISLGVRDFFQRTSHTTLAETPSPAETSSTEEFQDSTDELDIPQEAATAYRPLQAKAIIAAQIVGPAGIDVGQTEDFMVAVINPMNSTNRDLSVVLDVPNGLAITLLDRPADFNERKRTLTWKLKRIQPGDEIRLQYRVKSLRKGKQLQRATVRIDDELIDTHEVVTVAKLNLDVDANKLPYE